MLRIRYVTTQETFFNSPRTIIMFCFWWSTNLLRVADAQTLTAVNLFVFSVAVLHFLMVSLSHTQGDQVWLNQSNQIGRFQYQHLSKHKWTQFTYDYLWFQGGARAGGLLHSGESHGRGQVPKDSQQTIAIIVWDAQINLRSTGWCFKQARFK